MVIHSSVRSDGTLVEVIKKSNGQYMVQTTHPQTGIVKTQNVSEQQVRAMGFSREIEQH